MANRRYESVQSYLFKNRNNKINAQQFFERIDSVEAQIIKNSIHNDTIVLTKDVILNLLKLANDVFDKTAYMYVDDNDLSRYYNVLTKMKRIVIGVSNAEQKQSLFDTIAYIEQALNSGGTVNDNEMTMLIADFYDVYSNYNMPQALPRNRTFQPSSEPVATVPIPPPPPMSSVSVPPTKVPIPPPMPSEPPLNDRQMLLEAIKDEKNRSRVKTPTSKIELAPPATIVVESNPESESNKSMPPPPPPPPPPTPPLASSTPLQPSLTSEKTTTPLPSSTPPTITDVLSELKSGTIRLKPTRPRPNIIETPKSANMIVNVLADAMNKRRVVMAKSSSEEMSNDDDWDDNRSDRAKTYDVKYVQTLFNVFTSSQVYVNENDDKINKILNDVQSLLQEKTPTNIDKARLLLQDLANSVSLKENLLDNPSALLETNPLFKTNPSLFYKSVEDLIFKFKYQDAENHLVFALTYAPKEYKLKELLSNVKKLSLSQQRTESTA
ncbi:orf1629 [Palpita vitrealis nucleopolyhedrovirus]|uniref:Orf1629 n=1 Tax=Palpita vitrealis nucleopolyhedrovirus TaxID=2951960 RepID=A0AAE9LN55_9ABAC|nr:orf1629 [Palpita vitrealis nucleopolyhedrovirus]